MKRYRRFLFGTLLVVASACSPAPPPAGSPSTTAVTTLSAAAAPAPLVRILTDPVLWGPHFKLVIAALPAFEQQGDSAIAVFQSRAVGSRSFEGPAAAAKAANELAQSVALRKGIARQGIATMVDSARAMRAIPHATAVPDPEASTNRAGWADPSLQFLKPGVSIATLTGRLGQPERITRVVIDGGVERRPVVLTLYHYANDAIVFAESDWAPTPRMVDRVFLNVPRLTAALYQEGR